MLGLWRNLYTPEGKLVYTSTNLGSVSVPRGKGSGVWELGVHTGSQGAGVGFVPGHHTHSVGTVYVSRQATPLSSPPVLVFPEGYEIEGFNFHLGPQLGSTLEWAMGV